MILSTLNLLIDIYRWVLLAAIVASWVAPNSDHPVVVFLQKVTEPVLAPIRKVLPPMSGIDLSPLALLLVLYLLQRFVI